ARRSQCLRGIPRSRLVLFPSALNPLDGRRGRVSVARTSVRRPVARHGQLKSPGVWGQLTKMLAVALAVVLVSGLGTAAFAAWNAVEAVASSGVDIDDGEEAQLPPTIGEIEGGVNLLLVGTDSC